MRYDIAIIGTGPAGVSAALTARNRNKSILMIGSREGSVRVKKSHRIVNYPGLPDVSGEDLNRILLSQLHDAGIEITEKRAAGIYAMGDFFSIQADQDFLEAKTVILATGISFGKPLPGENENLGRGVSYCATCDAPLYKGKEAIVAAWSAKEEADAAFLTGVCSKVTCIRMYRASSEDGGSSKPPESDNFVSIIENRRPLSVERNGGRMRLNLQGGESIDADVIFLLRESVMPDKLVPGLEMDESHVKTGRAMETNLPGLYAAGDLTGSPYQIAKAVGEGNIAALSAAAYLDSAGG